ncbi:PfkB family carbohydrate kinase [Actinomadura viridis]|uniref:PfkB family carbohydrate kinase n=1 Tax=Actinomadura viridis TaxID=58110 RepID=UPI0036B5186C
MAGEARGGRRPHAVVIGNAIIDEVRTGAAVERRPGGAGFNLAVGLAVLGVQAGLVTALADDPDGRVLAESLRAHAVTVLPQPRRAATGRATASLENGEPGYAFTPAARGRVRFTPAVTGALREAHAVIVNSYPFDVPGEAERLDGALRDLPGLRVLDPNPRPGLVTDPGSFRRRLEALFGNTDIVKVSVEDLDLLYGCPPEAAVARILGLGPRVVFLTRGAAGAEIVTASGRRHTAPAAAMTAPIVDTIGAGDAALAALVASSLAGPPERRPTAAELAAVGWRPHLDRAMRVAAAVCRSPGGHPTAASLAAARGPLR